MPIRRLLLVRHGETEGNSSVRYHGRNDVPLSTAGRLQMERVAASLRDRAIDVWAASPLQRSWLGAHIVSDGAPVRIEADFREVDFGDWEGLTAQEIRSRDAAAFEQWQASPLSFDYPGGESRADFAKRVGSGTQRLLAAAGWTAGAVLHKGVIREIVRELTGDELERPQPELGVIVFVTRSRDGSGWMLGQPSTDPPGLRD